jgi:5-carboxymethyl-2-hydroxymuconate isomerase
MSKNASRMRAAAAKITVWTLESGLIPAGKPMPHLIIEVAHDAATPAQIPPLVDAVHAAARDSGLFQASHIKTRAIPVACYRTGSDDRPFIHAQLRVKPGRTAGQKKALTAAVLGAIRGQAPAAGVITVEVVEMDGASYAKYEA